MIEHKLNIKHLIGLEDTSKEDIEKIIDVGFLFREILERPIKKVPILNGKNIVNLFFENSTRTKLSFELAEKRLSADVTNFSSSSSFVISPLPFTTIFMKSCPFFMVFSILTSMFLSILFACSSVLKENSVLTSPRRNKVEKTPTTPKATPRNKLL
mgnify:CR=1 FL=1